MKQETVKNLQAIVRRNYETIACHYAQTRQKKLWSGLSGILADVRPGDRVLDVGCGSGKLLMELSSQPADYLGVDICQPLLDQARTDYPGFYFKSGDILKLGVLPEINFDHVFAIAVLQHIPSRELRVDALRQLKNKVGPTGRIIVSNWNMWSSQWTKPDFRRLYLKFFLLKLIGKNRMDTGDLIFDWKDSRGQIVSQRYYHMFTRRELKSISRQAGLRIDKLYKDDFNYYLILRR